ncbi:hypothetical protein ABPG72_016449 [Tetrahymena utriculariae]
MVKFIPTKRATKNLSVEEFWQVKQKLKSRDAEKLKRRVQVDLSGRYKFKSFKKEIQNIDVSLTHFIDEIKQQPYSQTDDNLGSYFLDELELQHAKCKISYYKKFYAQVVDLSQSLPLVLHNLDYIISLVVDNLNLPEVLFEDVSQKKNIKDKTNKQKVLLEASFDDDEDDEAQNDVAQIAFDEEEQDDDEDDLDDAIKLNQDMQAQAQQQIEQEEEPDIAKVRRKLMTPYMLQLLPEIIRDCQDLAYKVFIEKVFFRITDLIDLKNLSQLQLIYKVLAYSLKYFYRDILNNFEEFLGLYFNKLFLHKNKYVRSFSSESFSYIIKKMTQKERLLKVPKIFEMIRHKCVELRQEAEQDYTLQKYKVLQEQYLKDSVSHMLFSCLIGMHRFMTYRGMDQFKEIVEIILSQGKDNSDIQYVLCQYLEYSYKHFTIEQQADKLCFNLTDLFNALSLILSKNVTFDQEGFSLILRNICSKIIDFLDYKDAINLDEKNAPHIIEMLRVMIDYQNKYPDQLLKNSISGSIGRLFKRGFSSFSSRILTPEVNDFLLEKLSILETFEFFKLLIFPYEGKKEDVDRAYTFQEVIYDYCLVLAFRHIDKLFERPAADDKEDVQKTLHCMFFMMTMIHEQSFSHKKLQLKNSQTLLNIALNKLQTMLENYISYLNNPNPAKEQITEAKRCYREMMIFTKLSQFSDFKSQELVNKYEQLIKIINTQLQQKSEELGTQDFEEDKFMEANELYNFRESIVKKYELKSSIVNSTQKLSLLKSEMLIYVSSVLQDKTNEQLIAFEISFLNKYVENPNYLKNFSIFLQNTKRILTIAEHEQFFYQLCRNLRSKYTETRLASLQVLNLFQKLEYLQVDIQSNNETMPSILKGEINMIEMLLYIQKQIPSIDNERSIKLELMRMKTNAYAYPPIYHYLLFNFCLGYMFVRFALLWPIAKEIITHLFNLKKHPHIPYIFLNILAYYNYQLSPQFISKYNNSDQLFEDINDNEEEEDADEEENEEEQDNNQLNHKKMEIELQQGESDFFDSLFNDYYLFEGDAIENKLVFENIFKALSESKRESIDATIKQQIICIMKQFFENEHREIEFIIQDYQKITELQIVQRQLDNQIAINKNLYVKYTHFLQIFINFISVKDIEKQHFYEIFLELLRKNKENIQQLALDCILKFEKASLHKYQQSLKQLTKKENLRREMLNLNLNRDSKQIEDSHRVDVIPVIINILYPHLFTKKGSHHKSKKHSELQRNVIYGFFSSLQPNELGYVIDLVFKNFHIPEFTNEQILLTNQKELLQLHLNKISQFNINIKNMMQKLGLLLKPFFNRIFNYLLSLFSSCQILKSQIKQAKNDQQMLESEESKVNRIYKSVKKLQKQALERYSEICRRYRNQLSGTKDFVENFLQIMDNKIQMLRQDTVTSVPGVLKIMSIWSQDSQFYEYFLKYEYIVPILISLYNREKINVQIIQLVHNIFSQLLGIQSGIEKKHSPEEDMEEEEEEEEENADVDDEQEIESEELDEMDVEEEEQFDEKNNKQLKITKSILKTTKVVSVTDQNMKQKISEYMKQHYNSLLESMYSYLEYNLAPSQMIKRNKQKKIDSLSLEIIDHISANVQSIEENLSLKYLNYFIKFLDAANIKKLKDVASTPSTSNSEENGNKKGKTRLQELGDKFDIFYKVLSINNNFLRLNKDNTPFYKPFISILPFTQSEEFKKLAVKCVTSLKLPFHNDQIIEVLQNMSIYERSIKQTLNYDKFLDAVYKVNTEYMKQWFKGDLRCVETYFMMLMSSCDDSEMSVRMAINSSFDALFKLTSEHQESLSEENIQTIKAYLFFRLLPFVAKELRKTKEEYVVKNVIQILKLYLQFIPTIKIENFFQTDSFNYVELRALIHTDENQDFFECITHIQMNKRIKGMNILMKTVEQIKDQSNIWNIVLPIIEWIILYKCQEIYKANNKTKLTDITLQHYKLLLQSAINTVGIISKNLSVAKVKKILKKYVQFLSNKRFDQKITIKVLGSVLETLNLPYNIVSEVNREMENIQEKKMENTLLYDMIQKNKEYDNPNQELQDDEPVENNDLAEVQPYDLVMDEKLDTNVHKEKWIENLEREKFYIKNQELELDQIASKDSDMSNYYRFLRLQVFLPMKQLLFDQYSKAYNKFAKVTLADKQKNKSDEKIRIFMTIALIKLLIKFPKEIFRIEFPKLVNKVVKNLRTKDNDERNFTRKVLLEIVRMTGPYFFHYIVKELKFFLKNGWESHILNYTIYTLLTELDNKKIPIGSLDYCHSEIFPLLVDEIFGKLMEEKDLQMTKIPEQKKNKANATFQLFAKNLDFRNVINFLAFIRQQLVENLDGSKNLGKFEELFNFILEGFAKNESVQHTELVTVSYSLIKDALELIESTKKKERLNDTTIAEQVIDKKQLVKHNLAKTYEILEVTAQNKSIFQSIQDSKKKNKFKIGCCMCNFGLKLCLMGIKKSIFAPEQIANQIQFEQLIKVIVECLKSTDNTMIISSLRILKTVITRKEAKGIRKATVAAVLAILEKLTNTDIEMISETFKLINTIIDHSQNSLKNSQYKALLLYVKQFLDVSDYCSEPLNSLNIIIEKKLIYEEVYDLVNSKVREAMIQSYAQNINSICKQIYLNFLIKYPISDTIMQSSINFLIKNTEYSYDQGRIIVYDILKIIIKSFPDKVLTYFGEIIYVSYLVNLIKEENKEIRETIKLSQQLLISRLSIEQKQRLITNNLQWITQHNNPKIQQSGFIGLRLFLEDKQDFLSKEEEIKLQISQIFDSREERMNIFWEIIKQKKEKKEALKNSEWKNYIDTEIEVEEKQNENELTNDTLLNSVLEFVLAYNKYLKERELPNTLIFEGKRKLICNIIQYINFPNQDTSNLTMHCLMELTETNQSMAKQAFKDGIQVVVSLLPKVLKYLYFSKLKNNFVISNTLNSHKFFIFVMKFFLSCDQETIAISLFENILKIFLRSYVKAYYNKSQIEYIVELILHLAQNMSSDEDKELVNEIKNYMLKNERALEIVLEILIKVKTFDNNNKISNQETIEKAELAIEQLKKSIELNNFFQMYSKVKSGIEAIRQERKQQQKQDLVANPEVAFEKKQEQNLKKRKAKQNKIRNSKRSENIGRKILKKD